MPDDAARWRRLESVVHAALARPVEERATFLAEACGDDSNLRRDAVSLLERDGRDDRFLGTPLEALAADAIFAPKGTAPMDEPRSLSGSRIGAYEIRERVGSGGMGIVYRARDTRLHRDVAVKVLLPAVTDDPDRLARFAREARILASLNHPHIAQIHGLEESDGVSALVMELVEGPTLADRIARGALPSEEALGIAKQIADALEAAHAQGIVHRDLKPANVKVRPDGTVKVLDFGLAKAVERPGVPAPSLSVAPPITTAPRAEAGPILGTAAYMSPEQARGLPVDARTDIWAFGVLLFEMLSGRRPFEGADLTEVLSAVLRLEPDWTALPPQVPARMRQVIRACLQKDPRQRIAHVQDVRLALDGAFDAASVDASSNAAATTRLVWRWPWATAAALATAGLAALAWSLSRPASIAANAPTVRFELVPPPLHALEILEADRNIAISPDGRQIAYRGGRGLAQLVIRSLDRLEARALENVVSARSPFFSADGQWIGFFDGQHLKRIHITGGSAVTIAEETRLPRGASWGDDNRIVYATYESGLIEISAYGGEPRALTTPNQVSGERSHWHPFVLPGNRGVLYTIAFPNQADQGRVAVLDFRTGQQKTLLRPGTQAAYAPTGHLIYIASSTLMAVRFDIDRLEAVGDPMPVVDGVRMSPGGTADYAISGTGTLLYVPAAVTDAPRSLAWVDRQGRESPISAPPRNYGQPRVSPDGGRVAVVIRDRQSDIAVWDLARETLMPLAFTSQFEEYPVWTRDGKRIAFASRDGNVMALNLRSADGMGTAERFTSGAQDPIPAFVAPDGTGILGTRTSPQGAGDIVWFLSTPAGAPPSGPPRVKPLLQTPFTEYHPDVSPNGRYLAYQSNESGRPEIYVETLSQPGTGGRWRLSAQGGTIPVWARDGTELFYVDAANMLMAVPIDTSTENSGLARHQDCSK